MNYTDDIDKREERARLWVGFYRESAVHAMRTVFPSVREGTPLYVKLMMAIGEFLITHSDWTVRDTEECSWEEREELREYARSAYMEELIPWTMPEAEQQELALFLYRCLEEKTPLKEQLEELLPESAGTVDETVQAIRNEAGEALDDLAMKRRLERHPREDPLRPLFPPDYPYMDEFEYIDSCIAGEDE